MLYHEKITDIWYLIFYLLMFLVSGYVSLYIATLYNVNSWRKSLSKWFQQPSFASERPRNRPFRPTKKHRNRTFTPPIYLETPQKCRIYTMLNSRVNGQFWPFKSTNQSYFCQIKTQHWAFIETTVHRLPVLAPVRSPHRTVPSRQSRCAPWESPWLGKIFSPVRKKVFS